MIYSLRGIVQELTPTFAVVDVNGGGILHRNKSADLTKSKTGIRCPVIYTANHKRGCTFVIRIFYQAGKRNVQSVN